MEVLAEVGWHISNAGSSPQAVMKPKGQLTLWKGVKLEAPSPGGR
jgi:hypothetical protein